MILLEREGGREEKSGNISMIIVSDRMLKLSPFHLSRCRVTSAGIPERISLLTLSRYGASLYLLQ